jgi:protein-S-isoprenylcysteine O-methyltransferase Ste14
MTSSDNTPQPAKPPPTRRRDTAGVVAAPPLIFGAALILATAMHLAVSAVHIVERPGTVLRAAAIALIIGGLLLSGVVMRVFGRAGTPVPPYRPATRLVTSGPYRYSRNPDYVGQTLLYVGIALVANSWWPLLLLPLVLVVVQRGVIEREERYLEARFGQEYRDYKVRVRRWL